MMMMKMKACVCYRLKRIDELLTQSVRFIFSEHIYNIFRS